MQTVLPVTVAIVHAHELVRIGLRTILEHSGAAQVVLERPDPKGLHAALPSEGVQVVLLYIGTAVQLALDAVHGLRQRRPGTGVLLLGDLTPLTARRAVEACVGGMLHSAATAEELLRGVAVVAQGGLYMNGQMRELLLARHRKSTKAAVSLSPMQRRVLRMLCRPEHLTRLQMATELGIGKRTVDTHMESLFRKFKVRKRHELAHRATVLGLFG